VTRSIGFTDIDFDRDGRQVGFVSFPSSVHDDAWGVIRVPLTVIRNGSGPTVILQGGNHGDEYEGPIVLGEIIRDLKPETVNGRLIVVPAVNLPAVEASRRVSPLDDLNFNRTFPGDPLGSITQQISHYVGSVLYPLADAFIDLHSGGSALAIIPGAAREPCADPGLDAPNRAAVESRQAPFKVPWSNCGDPRTSTAAAAHALLATERTCMAVTRTAPPEAVRICRRGVANVLRHLGVLEGAVEKGEGTPGFHAIAGTASYVMASEAGIFEPYHELGAAVEKGQPAGRIHFLENPGREPVELYFGASGIVYGKRHPGRVRPGNCCLVVASPLEG